MLVLSLKSNFNNLQLVVQKNGKKQWFLSKY